jgi:hypothetical protein
MLPIRREFFALGQIEIDRLQAQVIEFVNHGTMRWMGMMRLQVRGIAKVHDDAMREAAMVPAPIFARCDGQQPRNERLQPLDVLQGDANSSGVVSTPGCSNTTCVIISICPFSS